MLSGGSSSIIAIAVGCAENTRTKDGKFTAAWDGHEDPGNGARNQGSFSYQGPASSATDADRKQIEKFRTILLPRFLELFGGQALTRVQSRILWAIACDCFTQSELACTGQGGFLDQLKKYIKEPAIVYKSQLDWFVEWRYQAYFDPKTEQLDAPGFGNNPTRLRADQERRTKAVLEAIA